MTRIVHIGAGSAGLGKRFLADVPTRPSLRDATLALDPLTASVCTLEQIRAMVAELFEADRPYLPQFAPT